MNKLTVSSTMVLAAFAVTACGDRESVVAEPTSFSVSGVSLDVTTGQPLPGDENDRSCLPTVPFIIPLDLSVRTGGLNVTVTDISARFVNPTGIPMPPVTLPAPVLTTQFGSMLIAARSARTIPLVIPIGCVGDPTGTIVIVVGTRDERGNTNSMEIRSRVRG